MELQYEDLIEIDKEYYFLKKYMRGPILGYCYARDLGYDETFEEIDVSRIIVDEWYED